MEKSILAVICGLIVIGGTPSRVTGDHHEKTAGHPMMGMKMAVADLQAAPGQQVKGTVTFMQHGERVTVVADVRGLPPNSTHGFHIHEKGVCDPPDFTSAGGHFNPGGHPHAGPDTTPRHAGDLGNLEAGPTGRAYKRMVLSNITLGEGANSVLDKAVIVHEKMDDLKSQPTGDAGGRIACGLVRMAMPGATMMKK